MRRDPSIPLFLWVATAALAHILWGGGADEVVKVLEGQKDIANLADSVRLHVQRSNQRFEISLLDEAQLPPLDDKRERAGLEAPTEDTPDPKEVDPDKPEKQKQPAPKRAQTRPEKQANIKPEPEKPKPPEPKREQEKAKAVEKLNVPPVEVDRRIAVDQHVKDPKQQDNPDARFIAQQANRVEQETQARITSRDQNDPDPTPGQTHVGPEQNPGDSVTNDVAHSEDSPGDPNKAAINKNDGKPVEQPVVTGASGARSQALAVGQAGPQNAIPTPNSRPQLEASKGQRAQAQRQAVDASPNTVSGQSGAFSVTPEQLQQAAQAARRAQAERERPKAQRKMPDIRGFGSMGTTPGGLNPNLNPITAMEAVGAQQLAQERLADGERRRSKHRGSWRAVGLERWRSAIENYVASVQPGNQTSLNTAAVPFARFLNQVHNQIHGMFADTFLSSLDSLPADNPMNRRDLYTNLELVLSQEDGRLVRMGVTRASGSTMFDVSALESVQRAAPFGPAPPEIVSPDGNVYLHWEFHRDPDKACSTYFARPYLLRVKPKSAPSPGPLRQPEPEEHGSTSPESAPPASSSNDSSEKRPG
jgi:TonB family protein